MNRVCKQTPKRLDPISFDFVIAKIRVKWYTRSTDLNHWNFYQMTTYNDIIMNKSDDRNPLIMNLY